MFGHQFFKYARDRHDVRVTLRQDLPAYQEYSLFDASNAYTGIDVRSLGRLVEVLADFRPEAIVNGVGIVKQRRTASDSIPSLEINSLLPHRLAELARATGARLVHLSTDCVFSGSRGMYREEELPDAYDLYGKSKYLGEVAGPGALTLRTSIIGPELSRKKSLLEWFLAQRGPVQGFRRAVFSGFTTLELSKITENLLVNHPQAQGLYQVSSEPIDKYTLLQLIAAHYRLDTVITEDQAVQIDRSLDSTRFRQEFGYTPPSWDEMVAEMAAEHLYRTRPVES